MSSTASATLWLKEGGELHLNQGLFGGWSLEGRAVSFGIRQKVAGASWKNPRGWPKRSYVLQHFEDFLMLLRRNAISFSMINKLKIVDFAFHTFVFFAFIRDCSLFVIFLEVWDLLSLSGKFSPLGSTRRKKRRKAKIVGTWKWTVCLRGRETP